MIHLKNNSEIEKLYRAGQVVKNTLFLVEESVKPGITTIDLDNIAEQYIKSEKCIPGFKGLYGYPSTLCISIDDEVVHGLPKNKALKEGQIVGIDVGAIFDGFYGDHAKTFAVGKIDAEAEKLLDIGEAALMVGIAQATSGNRLFDISAAIQEFAEAGGYGIVRDFVGHGVGTSLHEEPQVPNFGTAGTGIKLRPGLVLALEPMINQGTHEVEVMEDGWTVRTKDHKLSVHFEHSVAITENGPEILSKI